MPRFPVLRLGAIALAALQSGCATPGPPPPADVPAAEFLGVAHAIEFTDGELPLDADGALPQRLATQDAIRIALVAAPELQAALARVRVAEAEARQERLLPNPVLSVSFRLAEGGESPGLDLGIAQDLYALLTRPDRSGVVDARLRAAVEEAVVVALDVAAGAATLVADVRAAEDRVPLLEDRVRLLGRVRDAAQARFESGEGRPLDVTSADEEIASAELDLLDARSGTRAARLALARRLGRPRDAATWTIDAPDLPSGAGSETAWIDAALGRRPEMRAIAWELEALDAEARLAGLVRREGTTAGLEAEGTKDWEVGPSVSVPLPLFDDGSVRREAVLSRIAEARHRRTSAARAVVEDVRVAFAARSAADDALRLAQDRLLPLAERRRAEADAVYRAGEADLTDVLLAEEALQEARLRTAELRSRSIHSQIRLHRAAGGAAQAPQAPAPPVPLEGEPHEAR